MFSKACEYGIKSLIYIVGESKQSNKVSLLDVSAATNSPKSYTSKILQKLVKAQIIVSEKGPTGGFSVDLLTLDTLNLSKIVLAIDGNQIYTACGLGLELCNANQPCPVHDQFIKIRNEIKTMLDKTFVEQLAKETKSGLAFLKR